MDWITVISFGEVILLSLFLIFSFFIKNKKKRFISLGVAFLLFGEALFFLFYNKQSVGTFLQDFILFLFTLFGYFLLLLGFKEIMK